MASSAGSSVAAAAGPAQAFVGAPVARAQVHQGRASSDPKVKPTSASSTGLATAMFAVGTAGAAAARSRARGGAALRRLLRAGPAGTKLSVQPSAVSLSAEGRASFSAVAMQAAAVAEAPVKTATSYEVGQKLHGWTCVRAEYIKEFSCSGYLFQHDKMLGSFLQHPSYRYQALRSS